MSKPIRMCINCKQRLYQNELKRLRCEEKRILPYGGVGRSFYICKSCLEDRNLAKNLARVCKIDPAAALKMLKEIIDNG